MCVNCNDSLQVNLPVAPSGLNGTDGQSAYVYIATANTNTGTGFTYPMNPSQPYIAIITTTTPIVNPVAGDFTGQWHYWVGPSGAAGTNGTNGTNGANGVNGAISLNYKWNNDTSINPPTATYVKVNNTNIGLATTLYIHVNDANNSVVGNVLAYMINSTNPTKSIITITKKGTPTIFAHFAVIGGSPQVGISGNYYLVAVTPLSASSTAPFTLNDDVIFSFSIVGNQGGSGSVGPTGPQGPIGPQGPAGSANLTRPSANTSYTFSNYLETDQGTTPTNYFQYSVGSGNPVGGDFKCFDSTGAATAVKANVTMIKISTLGGGPTDYSTVMANIGTNGTITFDNTSGSTAIYDILDTVYTAGSPGYLTLYVSLNTGLGSFLAAGSGHYDVTIESMYSLVLPNQNYSRILLSNTGSTPGGLDRNLVTLRAPQAAAVGTLMVVEVGAALGTNDLYITYGYNETGSTSAYTSTLDVQVDYTKSTSHNNAYAASSPISIKLDTGGQSALLQFYVVASDSTGNVSPYRKSLAFMGGNIYSR